MRFLFDFAGFVWSNLRLSVRRLGVESVWYKTLFALTSVFGKYSEKASWMYNQIWLDTATDNGLDLWGRRYRVSRIGESDDDYRIRILQKKAINTSGVSLSDKRGYIASILGTDVSNVTINNNIRLSGFGMGSAIGGMVRSRNYTIYGFVIDIPFLITAAKRARMIELVKDTNLGGNYPVFVERTGEFEVMEMGTAMGRVIRSRNLSLDNGIYSVY